MPNTIIGKFIGWELFAQTDIRANTPNNVEYYTIVNLEWEVFQEIMNPMNDYKTKVQEILSNYLK